ncbi:MAG: septum site-determining protein MinD [Clostridia bacterium]|nr:septum site-determining protein MinD [Clostridia bacterium]
MAKIYLVASGKGGVGKTTICANLGIAYAKDGYNVILVDGDIGLNNLDVTLGVEDRIRYDIVDVLEGKAKLNQALIAMDGLKNLRLLPSSKVNVSERIRTPMFKKVVDELSEQADYIFIDAPAGIEYGFHRCATASQQAIIVTTPHISAIKDADKAIATLSTYSLKGIGIVVNRVRQDLVDKGEVLDAESIADLLRCPLYGVIPESDRIGIYSVVEGRGRDKARFAYDQLKDNLIRGVMINKRVKSKGILGRLFG